MLSLMESGLRLQYLPMKMVIKMEYKKRSVGAVIAGYLAGIVEMIYVFIVDFNDCTKNCKKLS